MWILYGLLAAISAACVTIFGQMGLKEVNPLTATTLRSIIMASVLILMFWYQKPTTSLSYKHIGYIALGGICGAASWLFYFLALKSGPMRAVAALDRLSIVFITLLAALFFKEQITLHTGIGLTLLLSGSWLLLIG